MKYGNVEFGENGLVMEVKYSENSQQGFLDDKQKEEAFKCAIDFLKGRMEHCVKELNENVYRASYVSRDVVQWEGGHFSKPVYEDIKKAVEVKDWRSFSKSQLLQIVRALHFNSAKDNFWGSRTKNNTFNIASELMLCK